MAAPTESAFTSTSSSLLVSLRNGVGILTLADINQSDRNCSDFGFGVEQGFEFAQARLDFARLADMAGHRFECLEPVAGDAQHRRIVRSYFAGVDQLLGDANGDAAGSFGENT